MTEMYSFEGDFRRRPVQSLGGASKKEHRDVLIEKRQEDRRKREDCRRQHGSALTIQAFYRGAKVRKKQCVTMRGYFDSLVQTSATPSTQINHLLELTRYLLFFYSDAKDAARLTLLSQQILRVPVALAEAVCQHDGSVLFQLKRLLALCCRLLELLAVGQGAVAMPMRMLEVFTHADTYCRSCDAQRANQIVCLILQYLVHNGYYRCLRALVEQRIPASLEPTEEAPTAFAASVLQLIKKPLSCETSDTENPAFRGAALRSLCSELLCRPHSVQTHLFLVPSLAVVAGDDVLHFGALLAALVPAALRSRLDQQRMPAMSGRTAPTPDDEWTLAVDASPWLLWSILMLSRYQLGTLSTASLELYLLVLSKLVPLIHKWTARSTSQLNYESASESDDETMQSDEQSETAHVGALQRDCLQMLDSPAQVTAIVSTVLRSHGRPPSSVLNALCLICHGLMMHSKLAVHRKRLLYSLAFNPDFLRDLWFTCISVTKPAVTGEATPLLQLLSRGSHLSASDRDRILPLLSLFASLFSHSLLSLHDSEFYGTDSTGGPSLMPFSLVELVPMSLALRDTCLGIIELAHPDTKPALKEDYRKAFRSVGIVKGALSAVELQQQRHDWACLFKVTVQLVKQLYARDSRQAFCPSSHWLARQVNIQADKPSQFYKLQGSLFMRRSFGDLSTLNPTRVVDDDSPPLSTVEVRNLTILTELPFVISFQERVKIFQRLIQQDRLETQGEMRHLAGGPSIQLMVRRNYLYEDAFEKLSVENEPNLRLRMQVQLVNFAGLDEAGIDGGGIFREFMSELMKTSFDPNRGFFRHTSDQLLYPNPGARMLLPDYVQHYFFLGRILGKAIYENMLVELPFASFFLSKILSRHRGDVDIHHLASLDPEMYKNLLFLKNFDGDVNELGLNFTVVNNDLGEAQVVELKPGGHDIAVTNHNTIEYIHRMADYRLNKQMRGHCNAFRQGLADVVNIEWLRMFDHNEVQLLISGSVVSIDLEDLRQNTNYSGGYSTEHTVIQFFWTVVFGFTDKQRRQLLKFVTSCSRPPLLGFKYLYPAFCVHHAGNEEDRLPTASTCMNLLKLPEFSDETTLRLKLLYALESGAGFELS